MHAYLYLMQAASATPPSIITEETLLLEKQNEAEWRRIDNIYNERSKYEEQTSRVLNRFIVTVCLYSGIEALSHFVHIQRSNDDNTVWW